jgi:hypothetical protein
MTLDPWSDGSRTHAEENSVGQYRLPFMIIRLPRGKNSKSLKTSAKGLS